VVCALSLRQAELYLVRRLYGVASASRLLKIIGLFYRLSIA